MVDTRILFTFQFIVDMLAQSCNELKYLFALQSLQLRLFVDIATAMK